MVEELGLADHDVVFIAEFIDYLLSKILPDWKPLSNCFSSRDKCASDFSLISDLWEMPESMVKHDNTTKFNMNRQICLPSDSNNMHENFTLVSPSAFTSSCSTKLLNKFSLGSEFMGEDSSLKNEMFQSSHRTVSEMESRDHYDECRTSENGSLSSKWQSMDCLMEKLDLSCADQEVSEAGSFMSCRSSLNLLDVDLELELDAIETQHQKWLQELSRMKQAAIEEATKKRWMTKKNEDVH